MNESAEFYGVDVIHFDWNIGMVTGRVLSNKTKEVVAMSMIPYCSVEDLQTEPFVKWMIDRHKFHGYVGVRWAAQDGSELDTDTMERELKRMVRDSRELVGFYGAIW